ncbi:TetR/AcrR family transcriptional regulator, partial [Mesorhizobium sp. M00.F.Ca.ET.186.01.1.1]
ASYFETLFRLLEEQETMQEHVSAIQRLEQVIQLYLRFQMEHAPITRLIHRELSVESMLAREVMTLYMSRWKHGLSRVLEGGVAAGDFLPVSIDRIVLAVSSQMIYPFLQPQMVRQVYDLEPFSEEFARWLQDSIMRFLHGILLPA